METIAETDLPNRLFRGKVRDTYDLGEGLLLMVATDRISAFDVVLPTSIPEKGIVLAHLSSFWFSETASVMPNHFVALVADSSGKMNIFNDISLPPMSSEIARRSMIVKRAERVDVECVARGYITGSGWAQYKQSGTINGQVIPDGLKEGDKFPEPIFTPTTKADQGHDMALTFEELEAQVSPSLALELKQRTLELYTFAHDYALNKGIIIADTKFEFGMIDGELTLIDEVLTPDSSRFWDAEAYKPGQSLPNFDKQFVRDWLTDSAGWDRESTPPPLPEEIVEKTRERYWEAYRLLVNTA